MDAETYISTYPASAKQNPELLIAPPFRELLCRQLHPTPSRKHLPLIREMFQQEIQYHLEISQDHEYFENLYWTALFLFQIGELDDVLPMWRAKHINFDTGCGFDIQFLVGCGVNETIKFLRNCNEPDAGFAAEYIQKCQVAGDLSNLDDWLSTRIKYFQ